MKVLIFLLVFATLSLGGLKDCSAVLGRGKTFLNPDKESYVDVRLHSHVPPGFSYTSDWHQGYIVWWWNTVDPI